MPMLTKEPDSKIATLEQLMTIASAMESQAVRLYIALADEMDRQGADSVAVTFRTLAAMESAHVDDVQSWSRVVTGQPVTVTAEAEAAIWAQIAPPAAENAASTLLTPYRALSIGVQTEERAFAFYSYLIAHTDNDAVRHYAKTLARQELEHAAQLRVERRKAYHQEHMPSRISPVLPVINDLGHLEALSTALESQTAALLTILAQDVTRVNDGDATITLLTKMAEQWQKSAQQRRGKAKGPPIDSALVQHLLAPTPSPSSSKGASHESLARALQLLERLYDVYETIAERSLVESVMIAALASAEHTLSNLTLVREHRLALKTSSDSLAS